MSAYFITGTDTEVGKTFVTCALLHAYAAIGHRAAGMKPVAAGVDAAGCNEDVEALVAASTVAAPREYVSPYVFASPIAPHIAAAEEGRSIRFAPIHLALAGLQPLADTVLVEGVGGFRVPLGLEGDSADLAQTLGLPVILVVGLRLGCISHALLTVEAIEARGLRLAGWVANRVDSQMERAEDNVAAIAERVSAPLLGILPWFETTDAKSAARLLRLPQ
ncbi:MAG: dethiobiotin synthase [Rhodocyclaceae bacterium]|jgi:dethiobiotin synthetase|nr:dethiobiotin synthase [Rhodocyclaceae bacterium]